MRKRVAKLAKLLPTHEGATSLGPARQQVAVVEGQEGPTKTPKLGRSSIREPPPDGRVEPAALPG